MKIDEVKSVIIDFEMDITMTAGEALDRICGICFGRKIMLEPEEFVYFIELGEENE